jgi:hypothetical protein
MVFVRLCPHGKATGYYVFRKTANFNSIAPIELREVKSKCAKYALISSEICVNAAILSEFSNEILKSGWEHLGNAWRAAGVAPLAAAQSVLTHRSNRD